MTPTAPMLLKSNFETLFIRGALPPFFYFMREYNKDKGIYSFIFSNGDNEIKVSFCAGVPSLEGCIDETGLFKAVCGGVAGATLTIEGVSKKTGKRSVCSLSWASVVFAIFSRCKKTRNFDKKPSKRIGKFPMSMDKEKGRIIFSLPCVNDESAGIEIILTVPQGIEFFVNGEKQFSCVPDKKPTLKTDTSKILFKTWNNEKTNCPFVEIGLTELFEKFASVKLDKVNGESAERTLQVGQGNLATNEPVRVFFGEIIENYQRDQIGALWAFYAPFLWFPVRYEVPHMKKNLLYEWKSNLMFAWIFFRSLGYGRTSKN